MSVRYLYEMDKFIEKNGVKCQIMQKYFDKFHEMCYQTIAESIPYSNTDIFLIENLSISLNQDLYVCSQKIDNLPEEYVIWISNIECDRQILSKFLKMKAFW